MLRKLLATKHQSSDLRDAPLRMLDDAAVEGPGAGVDKLDAVIDELDEQHPRSEAVDLGLNGVDAARFLQWGGGFSRSAFSLGNPVHHRLARAACRMALFDAASTAGAPPSLNVGAASLQPYP